MLLWCFFDDPEQRLGPDDDSFRDARCIAIAVGEYHGELSTVLVAEFSWIEAEQGAKGADAPMVSRAAHGYPRFGNSPVALASDSSSSSRRASSTATRRPSR